jgi:hydroxymethylpyrimidine pyrophosphatase-like HAD family hydrolase
MVIAVDADGTLFDKSAFPKIGKANTELIDKLIGRQKKGDILILWTCREGELVESVVRWAGNYGLHFDAVNENYIHFEHAKHKIVADFYLDDRAITPDDFLNKNIDSIRVKSSWREK